MATRGTLRVGDLDPQLEVGHLRLGSVRGANPQDVASPGQIDEADRRRAAGDERIGLREHIDDEVTVRVPKGTRQFEIRDIRFD